jgi:hypothetical protein
MKYCILADKIILLIQLIILSFAHYYLLFVSGLCLKPCVRNCEYCLYLLSGKSYCYPYRRRIFIDYLIVPAAHAISLLQQ